MSNIKKLAVRLIEDMQHDSGCTFTLPQKITRKLDAACMNVTLTDAEVCMLVHGDEEERAALVSSKGLQVIDEMLENIFQNYCA